jgi:hypothetical protein
MSGFGKRFGCSNLRCPGWATSYIPQGLAFLTRAAAERSFLLGQRAPPRSSAAKSLAGAQVSCTRPVSRPNRAHSYPTQRRIYAAAHQSTAEKDRFASEEKSFRQHRMNFLEHLISDNSRNGARFRFISRSPTRQFMTDAMPRRQLRNFQVRMLPHGFEPCRKPLKAHRLGLHGWLACFGNSADVGRSPWTMGHE